METLYADEFYFLGLIVLAPLIGAIINGFFGAKLPRKVVDWVACGSIALSFIFALISLQGLVHHAEGYEGDGFGPYLSYTAYEWIFSGELNADIAFLFDPLTAVMVLVVTGVGLLIHIYSVGYMDEDPDKWRYFAYLNLFTFSMLMLVLGKNMLVTFIGWEGVGVCSYLLIGFWYSDAQKAQAGQKAFLVNRVGDFFFILGMFLIFYMTGTWDYVQLGEMAMSEDAQQLARLIPIALPAGLLIFLGCTGKSAQIPLYVWLPDAMAGPTPVSALIHAATMVTAGVFLLCRLNWMVTLSPTLMAIIAVVGALTALVAASIAIVQNDIKRVLAYSTVSQLGFMFMAVGMGAFVAAIFHLMTHAFFKALLFLGAGSVIHGMHHEQDIRKMGGLRKLMPWTHATFIAATAAIAGVPLFAGFFSKDLILWSAMSNAHVFNIEGVMSGIQESGQSLNDMVRELNVTEAPLEAVELVGMSAGLNWFIYLMALFTAGLTAFYMFRLYFMTFWGECRAEEETKKHIHESPNSMVVPLSVLGVLSVIGGWIGWPHVVAYQFGDRVQNVMLGLEKWLAQTFYVSDTYRIVGRFGYGSDIYLLEGLSIAAAILVAGIGIGLAYYMYIKRPELPGIVYERAQKIHKVLTNKYWVDEAYDVIFVRRTLDLGKASYWIDRYVISGFLVGGVSFLIQSLGRVLSNLQSGNVQRYSTYITVALVLIFIALLAAVMFGG